ncbi:hypothetical protein UY3_02010 [Chelonia mydas]|uniref:Uncharacterized protein n=1 Tax=Chelonia mydas TaxID=8469 RepID=M7BY66_CHEMY|nr:hypothetical protein UY3_02010 [Chelonia mydas]
MGEQQQSTHRGEDTTTNILAPYIRYWVRLAQNVDILGGHVGCGGNGDVSGSSGHPLGGLEMDFERQQRASVESGPEHSGLRLSPQSSPSHTDNVYLRMRS